LVRLILGACLFENNPAHFYHSSQNWVTFLSPPTNLLSLSASPPKIRRWFARTLCNSKFMRWSQKNLPFFTNLFYCFSTFNFCIWDDVMGVYTINNSLYFIWQWKNFFTKSWSTTYILFTNLKALSDLLTIGLLIASNVPQNNCL
jgi:hypothetical protein